MLLSAAEHTHRVEYAYDSYAHICKYSDPHVCYPGSAESKTKEFDKESKYDILL